jgi:septal ring factor EnvC (AmiA/AmiB activator)
VPELRGETEILLGDLKELSRLVASINSERDRLMKTVSEQAGEQKRLSLLLDEKQKLQASSEENLAAEEARMSELTADAASLRELIDALEGEIEIAARRADEESRVAAAETAPPSASRWNAVRPQVPAANAPFSALLGQVALPVAGRVERGFGGPDGSGGTLQGDMLATHSAAIVTAPVNGSILYAGPFRSYGQLLILNAGDGYHVVLAGMGRISVVPGQSVLAGEPVGLMGETRVASAVAFGEADAGPELYVEFRKEGKPVDPAPWWAERTVGRTGNDT